MRASRTAKEGGRVCTDIFVSSARRRRRRRQPIWLGRGNMAETQKSESKSYVIRRWKIKKYCQNFRYRMDTGKWSILNLTYFLWISECRKFHSWNYIALVGHWKVSCPISYRAMLICSTLSLKSTIRWNRILRKLLYWSKSSDFQVLSSVCTFWTWPAVLPESLKTFW